MSRSDAIEPPADVPFLPRGTGLVILGRCLLCNKTRPGRKARPARALRPTWIGWGCRP